MTKQNLSLTFLHDCLSFSSSSLPTFKLGLSTYGHPEENVPQTILTQIETWTDSWSPSIEFRKASDEELCQIKNFDLDKYHFTNWTLYSGYFAAIDIEARAIVQFRILLSDDDRSFPSGKLFSFSKYSPWIYWLGVKKRPIKSYSEIYKALAGSRSAYMEDERKIKVLDAEIARLVAKRKRIVGSHRTHDATFTSLDVLQSTITQCANLALNETEAEAETETGAEREVDKENEKQKGDNKEERDKQEGEEDEEDGQFIGFDIIPDKSGKEELVGEQGGEQGGEQEGEQGGEQEGEQGGDDLSRSKTSEQEDKEEISISHVPEPNHTQEVSHTQGVNHIPGLKRRVYGPKDFSIKRFPHLQNGPFYITEKVIPGTVMLGNMKVLGFSRIKLDLFSTVSANTKIYPLKTNQRQYWETMGVEFCPEPPAYGLPIQWYNLGGEIKAKYKEDWHKLKYDKMTRSQCLTLIRKRKNDQEDIEVEGFPNPQTGPFYISTVEPKIIFASTLKGTTVLGTFSEGRVFPLTVDQRQYWGEELKAQFGSEPQVKGTPIEWYNVNGTIKEEYKEDQD